MNLTIGAGFHHPCSGPQARAWYDRRPNSFDVPCLKNGLKNKIQGIKKTYILQNNGEPGNPLQNFFIVGCLVWNIFCSVTSSFIKYLGSNEALSKFAGTATKNNVISDEKWPNSHGLKLTCSRLHLDLFPFFRKFSILIRISDVMTIGRFLNF